MYYAVFQTGGKQYKVVQNSVIKVEKIPGEPGATVKFDQVLMIGESSKPAFIGTPMVGGAVVTAEIMSQHKTDKILVFKKKRRKNYRRMAGHRQGITEIKITNINKTYKDTEA